MKDVFIVSCGRTAIGKFGGTLKDVSASELGGIVVKEVLSKIGLDGKLVEEVIFGNGRQAGVGSNPARQVVAKSGLPLDIPAYTVNKNCGSGLKAVELGAQAIQCDQTDIVVVGGTENMSQIPYLLTGARWGLRMGHGEVLDSMFRDGFICPIANIHMGVTAENLAEKYHITRDEQDEFALASQQKYQQALESGKFADEIIPVEIKVKKNSVMFAQDEHPRKETTAEGLAKLPPAFIKNGTVTAGNASGVTDGAAALVLMSEEKLQELNLKPLARVIGFSSAGVDPNYMGIGPVPATQKLLKKTGISLSDIDLIELNEAFAAQALAVGKELELDYSKVNVNGGAIALGHPIAATGARLIVTLINELKRRQKKLGLATLCIGGGQGMSAIIENL